MGLISGKVLSRRKVELGRIKIGKKGEERPSQGGGTFQLPVKLDHFEVTTNDRGPDGNFIRDEAVHARIGDEPRELRGMLMYHRPEDNFLSELVVYDGTRRRSWCDGELCRTEKKPDGVPCARTEGRECSCKPYGRLHLQLWEADQTLGLHVFRTTSWETIANIQSVLLTIFEKIGTCHYAPVKLVMYESTDTHEDGTRSRSWKVALVLAVPFKEAAREVLEATSTVSRVRATIGSEVPLPTLPAGVVDDPDLEDLEEIQGGEA